MFGFPASTEFDKRIPKQKFYEKLDIDPAIKRSFVEKIRGIYWRNKLAATTLNLAKGDTVTEVEVFEVRLHEPKLDEAVLRQIDREIPYHILFILTAADKAQAWISYKELAASESHAARVNRYYHTDWLKAEELRFTITGLNMDAVYEELVRQVAGGILTKAPSENLKDSVERDEKRRYLEKQIGILENRLRKEKQLNRQFEINANIKSLRKELEICK